MIAEIKADFGEALSCKIDLPQKVMVVIDWEILKNIYPPPPDTIVIWVTAQPEGDYNQVIKDNQHCYHYLLTMFDDLLKLPNAHYFMGCTSFVKPTPDINKKFAVSTVMSGRCNLPGHFLRREMWDKRDQVRMPFDFYLGTHNRLSDDFYTKGIPLPAEKGDKIRVFDCMFHVAYDSYSRYNLFSEKLIDCFITKTVPIYWGCTNLSDFFNTNGMYVINSVDEAISVCNKITPDDYYNMTDAINDNYNRGLEYWNYEHQLSKIIKKILA